MKRFAVILTIAVAVIFNGVETASAQVAVGVQITIAPPILPVYVQPPCPVEGFLWTPGYWGYGARGYFWVPGVWMRPPGVGLLWTPGYWGFAGGFYGWHGGYWGPHIGFYGGVHYGYGYNGEGFCGGRWEGGAFRYNTAAWSVNNGFHNTYEDRSAAGSMPAASSASSSRVSFNGPGGNTSTPSASEREAMNENHTPASAEQQAHEKSASTMRGQQASINKGNPRTSAMDKPSGQRFNSQGHTVNTASAVHNTNRTGNASRGNSGGQRMNRQNNTTRATQSRGSMRQSGRSPGKAGSNGNGGGRGRR